MESLVAACGIILQWRGGGGLETTLPQKAKKKKIAEIGKKEKDSTCCKEN